MNKIVTLALLAMIAFTSHSYGAVVFKAEAAILKKVPSEKSMSVLLEKCNVAVLAIDIEIPDTIACPKLIQYSYADKLTSEELKMVTERELNFSLSKSIPREWKEIIAESFESQLSWVSETLSEGSGQYSAGEEKRIRKGMRDSSTAVDTFLVLISAKGKQLGAKVYEDLETLWAPKVNAKAIVILNVPNKTVDVILHGDLDG